MLRIVLPQLAHGNLSTHTKEPEAMQDARSSSNAMHQSLEIPTYSVVREWRHPSCKIPGLTRQETQPVVVEMQDAIQHTSALLNRGKIQ